MVLMYIDKKLVLYTKSFKTSSDHFNKSVKAKFSALNPFFALMLKDVAILKLKQFKFLM